MCALVFRGYCVFYVAIDRASLVISCEVYTFCTALLDVNSVAQTYVFTANIGLVHCAFASSSLPWSCLTVNPSIGVIVLPPSSRIILWRIVAGVLCMCMSRIYVVLQDFVGIVWHICDITPMQFCVVLFSAACLTAYAVLMLHADYLITSSFHYTFRLCCWCTCDVFDTLTYSAVLILVLLIYLFHSLYSPSRAAGMCR